MNMSQFAALLRLRFQLTWNQVRKGGQANSILFSIASVAVVLYIVSTFFFSVIAGTIWFSVDKGESTLFTWNILVATFLFGWMIHVLNRIQQNDVISVDKLLHLPISFSGAFLLNYTSSLANLTVVSFAPVFAGLALAMPIASGWPGLVAIPLSIAFVFMVTAITHQFREWLAERMQNKRTRGILMAVIPLLVVAFILLVSGSAGSDSLLDQLKLVPLGWLPAGIIAAESGDFLSASTGLLAMTAIGSGSLFLSFRSSMRKFTGDAGAKPAKETRIKTSESSDAWNDRQIWGSLPLVSEPTCGIAMAMMRSMRRAPEIFAALTPLALLTVFGFPYLIGMTGFDLPDWLIPGLPPCLLAIALLGFPAFLFSTFSYDRDGFRALMLSPVRRRDILFGKNLAIGVPTILLAWLTLAIVQIAFPVSPLKFLGYLVQMPAAYCLICIFGNVISVFCPVGLKRGSMTPVNARIIPVIALYAGVLAGPFIALVPVLFTIGVCFSAERATDVSMDWLFVLLSIVGLILSWLLYQKSLTLTGNMLWRRETDILSKVANIPD